MTGRQPSELLYDSEAALRLIDSAIEEIGEPDGRRAAETTDARSYGEVVALLGSLRERRVALERVAPGQELAYARSVLTDLENRLAELATVLDPTSQRSPIDARVQG
jgi:hypothetical protein